MVNLRENKLFLLTGITQYVICKQCIQYAHLFQCTNSQKECKLKTTFTTNYATMIPMFEESLEKRPWYTQTRIQKKKYKTYPPPKEKEKQTQINQTKMTRCPNPLISINITYVKVPNQSLLDKRKRKWPLQITFLW